MSKIRIRGLDRSMNMERKKRTISTVLTLLMVLMLVTPNVSEAALESVSGGVLSEYGVLAGSTITNTGPSVINGDIGLFPGTSFTQADAVVNGDLNINNALASSSQDELTAAYSIAEGLPITTEVTSELGGLTLTPGVYDSADGTFQITGTLILDAEGDPNAEFVFNSATSLITASGSDIQIINAANSCQVFWRVGSSATLGTNSTFVGTIMALTSITANNGATINGRLLARNGAVTLENNVINADTCIIAPYEEPVVEEPVIEEPVIEEPVVEEPIIEEPIIEEPVVEEPVVEYEREEREESRINVVKVVLDEDGNELENDDSEFTFELFRSVNGEWRSRGTKTVEGNGTVRFKDLTRGTYMIEEIDIPDNYYISSDNNIEIRLSSGETEEIEITNIKEDEILIVPETPVDVIETPDVPVEVYVPEVPEITEVPDVPELTEVPDVPSVPYVPNVPEVPEVPRLPRTGESSNSMGILGAMLILVGVLGIKFKKIKI